jgi:hypothetical protein
VQVQATAAAAQSRKSRRRNTERGMYMPMLPGIDPASGATQCIVHAVSRQPILPAGQFLGPWNLEAPQRIFWTTRGMPSTGPAASSCGSGEALKIQPAPPGMPFGVHIDVITSMANVLGPVPGVDVMAKRSQGWVKCEDRLPYYRGSSCSLPLPRLHD